MGRARESLKLHIVLPPKLAEALIAHCGAIGDRPGAVALDAIALFLDEMGEQLSEMDEGTVSGRVGCVQEPHPGCGAQFERDLARIAEIFTDLPELAP